MPNSVNQSANLLINTSIATIRIDCRIIAILVYLREGVLTISSAAVASFC